MEEGESVPPRPGRSGGGVGVLGRDFRRDKVCVLILSMIHQSVIIAC